MLRPRKKLTRKEIKEDALVTAYVRIQKFIQKFGKQLNIGGFIVLAIIVIGIFMIRSKRSAEFTAMARLSIAEQFYFVSDHARATTELTEIVNTYSGTRAAGTAAFFLANTYFATNDYDNAEKYYQTYIDDYSNNKMFTASCFAGIAACRESMEQLPEAARFYENAAQKYPNSFKAPFYLKEAGRCYVLAEEFEKGKEIYKMIIEKYPDSSIKQEAEFLFESL